MEKLFSSKTGISWSETRKNAWKSIVFGIGMFESIDSDFEIGNVYHLTTEFCGHVEGLVALWFLMLEPHAKHSLVLSPSFRGLKYIST